MISLRVSALWIAPCVAAAIPLVIAPGFLFFYDVTPKIALLCCGTALSLPFVDPRPLSATRTGRWFCLLLGAMFVSLLASTIFSTRMELSVFGTNWRQFGLITQSALLLFVFVAAADMSHGPERVRPYLQAGTVATLLIALYGILQYLGWDPWLDPRTYHIGAAPYTIVRPPGTLGYVTYCANYLVFGTAQALTLYRLDRSCKTGDRFSWPVLLSGAAALLATLAILLSGTRAAWLALLLGGLTLVILERKRPSKRALAVNATFAALAAIFYLSPAGLPLRSRMHWFREDPTGGARLYLWRDSLRLAARHSLLGSGPETFSIAFPLVQSRDLSRAFPEFYHESAHNMFLDTAVSQGLPGLLILFATVALGFGNRRNPVLLAGLVAILVCHQFSVFTVPTALAFLITIAMLLLPGGKPVPASQDRRMLWLFPISIALIFVAIRITVGDYHLARMRSALEASRFPDAEAQYFAARRWGSHADIWFSRKQITMRRILQALPSGISATTTAEDPYNAWMNLGLIYAQMDNAVQTERCIREAIATSPNWYKPHLALAQLFLATNRQQEGQRELQLARDLNPAAGK